MKHLLWSLATPLQVPAAQFILTLFQDLIADAAYAMASNIITIVTEHFISIKLQVSVYRIALVIFGGAPPISIFSFLEKGAITTAVPAG